MPERARVLGVLLAGGRSRRMGRDKALLELDGRTLAQRTREILLAALREAGEPRPEVRMSGSSPGLPHGIPDLVPDQGPLGGIRSVLRALADDTDWLVIVPVDMPWLDSQLLARLISGGLASGAAGARFAASELPLLVRVDEALRRAVETLCAPGADPSRRSVRELARTVGAAELELPAAAEASLLNANTPADWDRVLKGKEAR